jgi:hypothetical protein
MTQERLGPLSPMRHALLGAAADQGVRGTQEAAAHAACRKTQLGYFQDPERVQDPERCQFMPADVIADLEAYCGQALYSKELFEARPTAIETDVDDGGGAGGA